MLHDTSVRYGSLTRFFHWLVAVLVIHQFFKIADRINDGEHWVGDTFGPYHVSFGALILVLTLLRLFWRGKQSERPINTDSFAALANLSHKIMYVCMLALPPLGALAVVGHGHPVKIFGFTLIEKPADKIGWAHSIGELHSPIALLLCFLVILHTAAALYHHFIRKDDVLKRMV